MKKMLVVLTLSVLALLAGCGAPNVVSSVTVFHAMAQAQPTTGSQSSHTYMIEASPEQANNLEFNSYVTLLNEQLQRVGYVMVNKDPALKVSLKYGTSQTVASTQEPMPYGPYGFRRGAYPAWQTSVDTYYMQQMEVAISEVSDGKNIYTVRTRLLSASPELSLAMEYLMESAFQTYPGKNGMTETVSIPAHLR